MLTVLRYHLAHHSAGLKFRWGIVASTLDSLRIKQLAMQRGAGSVALLK